MCDKTKIFLWVGIVLLLGVGLVHVIDGPDAFEEAAYKGVLFYLNALACLAAAVAMLRQKAWGWQLGFWVSLLSLVAYVLSRTVGLPLLPPEPDEWFEPLGVLSLITEGGFVIVYFLAGKKPCCCR